MKTTGLWRRPTVDEYKHCRLVIDPERGLRLVSSDGRFWMTAGWVGREFLYVVRMSGTGAEVYRTSMLREARAHASRPSPQETP